MTCIYYRDRPTPTVDEHKNALKLSIYLGQKVHPCVAVIMAYEDATTGGINAGPDAQIFQFKRRTA